MLSQPREREDSVYESESEGTDNISLTDTDVSDWDENAQWETEEILVDADFDVEQEDGSVVTERQYLVKWKGYSKYKATWEPRENLENADLTLWKWNENRMRKTRGGTEPDFDVEQWEQEKAEIEAKRARRHERRNKKRRQLGHDEKTYADSDEEADDESESRVEPKPGSAVDESDTVSSKGRGSNVESVAESDSDEEAQAPTKKRRLENESGSDGPIRKKGRAMPVRSRSDSDFEHTKKPQEPRDKQPSNQQSAATQKRTSSTGTVGWINSLKKPISKAVSSVTRAGNVQTAPQAKMVRLLGPARKVVPSKPSLQPGMLTILYSTEVRPVEGLTTRGSQTRCCRPKHILQLFGSLETEEREGRIGKQKLPESQPSQ